MKSKILLLIKASKCEINGLYELNDYVKRSQIIKSNYNVKIITLNSVCSENTLLLYILTFKETILNSLKIAYSAIFFRPNLVYFTLSPVNTFLRDSIYVLILKIFNCKIVYHLHGRGIKYKMSKSIFYRELYNKVYSYTYVIHGSKKLLEDINQLSYIKHFIVPNGIPIIDNMQKPLKSKADNKVKLIYISNLIKTKGVLDFIDALKLVISENKNVKGIIVGQEADLNRNDLLKRISPFNNSIQYLGAKFGIEKNILLYDSDIFVFPTYYPTEAYPICLIEALQAGLAVITTDEAATTDIITDKVNGFIVAKNNPKIIADRIKVLINDSHLRKQMKKINREKYFSTYTVTHYEENIKNVFDKIQELNK